MKANSKHIALLLSVILMISLFIGMAKAASVSVALNLGKEWASSGPLSTTKQIRAYGYASEQNPRNTSAEIVDGTNRTMWSRGGIGPGVWWSRPAFLPVTDHKTFRLILAVASPVFWDCIATGTLTDD